MTKKTTTKKAPKAEDLKPSEVQRKHTSTYEEEAEKFKPSPSGCGALLKAKKPINHVMKLADVSQTNVEEGDTAVVLYDFTHEETGERALVMLLGEHRYMYMTKKFDEDFEVLREGTSKMKWSEKDSEDIKED